MSLRPVEISEIAHELNEQLVSAFVQKAWVPDASTCLLDFRLPGRSLLLGISLHPGAARIEECAQRPPSPPQPLPFQSLLRTLLVGARLTLVTQVAAKRVWLQFERQTQPIHLVVDLTPSAFVALLDASQSVRAVLPQARKLNDVTWNQLPFVVMASEAEPSRLSKPEGAFLPFAAAAHRLLATREKAEQEALWRKQHTAPLKTRLARIERTIVKVREELARAQTADTHRLLGELLLQNLHRIKRGDRQIRLTEYTETGLIERVVDLKPQMTPHQQAQWHLHQYRRMVRGQELAARRLQTLEREREETLAQLEHDDRAPAPPAAVLPKPKKTASERASPFREYRTTSGFRIWAGKNARGNDALTFRHARPNDVWFHARGVSGSHVVVALDKHQALPPEVLVEAAMLALHHSESKHEPAGEVSYSPVKYLRKPKHGAPGQVLLTNEKTIKVRMEPERLRALLATADAL